MRSFFTVCATAMRTGLAALTATSPVTSASSSSYESSRGGTRTPDPVINSHQSVAERIPQHQQNPHKNKKDTTSLDTNSLGSATVCATANRFAGECWVWA
jgi:hypothetical protein